MHFSLPFTGAKFSAFFYIYMMIASLLYMIPQTTSQSLFAEGSYNETELKVHLKKAIKIISIIIIPAIIVIFLADNIFCFLALL
jgi:O-antigen/teichoic acid export membrane protein